MKSRKWFWFFLVISLAWGFCAFGGVTTAGGLQSTSSLSSGSTQQAGEEEAEESSSLEVKELLEQAATFERQMRYKEAKQEYLKAVEKEPRNAVALNNLGWLLATCPADEVRNGREAVALAARACVVTKWKNAAAIQTLAVAFAEDGQLQKAIVLLVKLRSKLRSKLPASKHEEINRRLKLFRAGKTYRGVKPEPSKKPEPSSDEKPKLDEELTELLKKASMLEKAGRPAEAVELYEKAVERGKKVFGPDHVAVAQLMARQGGECLRLKQYDKAVSLFEEALPLLRKHLPKDHKGIVHCVNQLATSYYKTKQYEKALSLNTENLAACEASFGKDHANTLTSLLNLATVHLTLNQNEKALSLFKQWLERNERGEGEKNQGLLKVLGMIAETCKKMDRPDEAVKYLTRAWEVWKAQGSQGRLQEAGILLSLARTLSVAAEPENYGKAKEYATRAVEITTAASRKNDPQIATAKGVLAMVYRHFKKHAEAESALRDVVRTMENSLGKDHPATFIFRIELARLYLETDRAEKAEKICLPCVDIVEAKYGEEVDFPGAEGVLQLMAEIAGRTGHQAEAEARLKQLIQSVESRLGKEHPLLSNVLMQAGEAYDELGDVARAKACYTRCLEIRRAKLEPEDLRVAKALQHLGTHHLHAGQYAEAEPFYDQCLPIFQKELGDKHYLVADCLCNLGFLYMRTNRDDKAAKAFEDAGRMVAKSYGRKDKEALLSTLSYWGRFHAERKRFDKAEPFQKQALAKAVDLYGREHPRVAWECVYLADLYRATKRHTDAERLYRYAITVFEKTRGKNHPDLRVPLEDLGNLLTELGRSTEATPLLKRSKTLQKQDASK